MRFLHIVFVIYCPFWPSNPFLNAFRLWMILLTMSTWTPVVRFTIWFIEPLKFHLFFSGRLFSANNLTRFCNTSESCSIYLIPSWNTFWREQSINTVKFIECLTLQDNKLVQKHHTQLKHKSRHPTNKNGVFIKLRQIFQSVFT